MNNKQTLKVIDALKKSIENIGLEMTISNLTNNKNKCKDLIDFILNITCIEFGKSKEDLKKGKQNHTYKKLYLISSYLLYYHASLTQQEIGDILSKSKASINRFIKEINEYNENIKEQKITLVTLRNLEQQVVNQKKIIYNNG